jgi:hypothetical protein
MWVVGCCFSYVGLRCFGLLSVQGVVLLWDVPCLDDMGKVWFWGLCYAVVVILLDGCWSFDWLCVWWFSARLWFWMVFWWSYWVCVAGIPLLTYWSACTWPWYLVIDLIVYFIVNDYVWLLINWYWCFKKEFF